MPCSQAEIVKASYKRNPFNHMSVAYRTDIVRELGGYPSLHLKEDYGLWLQFIANNHRVRNINKVLVEANFDESSIFRRGGLKYVASERDLLELKNSLIGKRFNNFLIFVLRSAVFSFTQLRTEGHLQSVSP